MLSQVHCIATHDCKDCLSHVGSEFFGEEEYLPSYTVAKDGAEGLFGS